jgi:hypothetical protein
MEFLGKFSKSDIYMLIALTVGALISIIIFFVLNKTSCGKFWVILYVMSTIIYTIAGMRVFAY